MRQFVATLRHRPAPLVGIFVALVAASSIVTWAFSLGLSPSASSLPTERLAAATVIVSGEPKVRITSGSGDNSFTETVALTSYPPVRNSLVAKLAKIRGVRAAIAEDAVPLALRLSNGRIVTGTPAEPVTGYAWSSAPLTPFSLRVGEAPMTQRQLVIGTGLARSADLALGDRVQLVGSPLGLLTVVGIAAAPAGNPAGDGAVFLVQSVVDRLSGHTGTSDLIGLVAQRGVSPAVLGTRVLELLAGRHLLVTVGSARGSIENLTAASDLSNLSQLGGGTAPIFVLVSLFVVASTVALSVAERGRTIALLRAIGATSGQVRRLVIAELAALGVLGGLGGYLPGIWLASFSVHGLAAHQFIPLSTHPWRSPIGLLPAVGGGVVVAELAGLFAARRASRLRPSTALVEASIERRAPRPLRLVLGSAALAGGIVLSIEVLRQHDPSEQAQNAQFGLLALMAAIALLGPYLIAVAELCLRIPARAVGGVAGRLANAEIRGRSRRMAAAAVAIALPVCFTLAITTIDATQTHASATESQQRLAASAVLSAPSPGLDPSVLGAVQAAPGVRGAVGFIPTTVYLPVFDSASAEAVTPGPLISVFHLDVTSGSLTNFGPGDIALSTLAAGSDGADVPVGKMITTYLADGTPYRARVTAVFSRSLGFADVLVPTGAAGGGHLGATGLSQVLVNAPDVDVVQELARVQLSYPGLALARRSAVNAEYELLTNQTSYVNDLLLALIGLLAAVALVNTLVMTTLQGRDELVLLQRVGATDRQLIAARGIQSLQVALVGVVLGVGATVAAVVAVAKALTGSWTPSISWTTAAVILAIVVGLTLCATVAPTGRMLSSERAD